jgi:hypothetical protein
MRMHRSLLTSFAIALVLLPVASAAQGRGRHSRPDTTQTPAAPVRTASQMYWDAVRRSTGPIGFPQAAPDDPSTRRFHERRFAPGQGIFRPGPFGFVAPPAEPIYVPVYVPGPVVYLQAPSAMPPAVEPAPTPAPRRPERFYVIPGCYGGNRPPPQADALPAGCDIGKLRVSTW